MKSKETFTRSEADEIIRLIQEKLKADTNRQKKIRNKIRKIGFYASDYGFRNGYTVEQFLSVAKINPSNTNPINNSVQKLATPTIKTLVSPLKSRTQSDEIYVIGLCDEILQ